MDFEEVCGREEVSVFVMVPELLERDEERRDGTEKDFLRFWREMGMKRNEGQLFRLHGRQYRHESGE